MVKFCGVKMRLWKPDWAVSDTTLENFSPTGTFLAMKFSFATPMDPDFSSGLTFSQDLRMPWRLGTIPVLRLT